MTDKKLTDRELEQATGAGPGISGQKTSNRGTYGTGQVEQGPGSGETEPNPLRDEELGEIRGGASYSVSSQRTTPRGTLRTAPTGEDPGNVGNTDPD